MSDLSYPIGRFARPESCTAELRAQFLEDIAQTPLALEKAVAGLDDSQLDTAYRPGGWTVRQVIHHVADSHMNSYLRSKFAVAEDNFTVKPYDEALWATYDDAAHEPIATSLTLLTSLHRRWVRFLRSLPEAAFSRTLFHPENGPMTLNMLVALYAWHGRHHTRHITSLRERMSW